MLAIVPPDKDIHTYLPDEPCGRCGVCVSLKAGRVEWLDADIDCCNASGSVVRMVMGVKVTHFNGEMET